jgi:rhomboid protease GluP
MSETRESPIEALLLLIAKSAPQPWYYQVHARETRSKPDALLEIMEWLWLDGLVQKAPGTPETGPGLTLTPLGEQLVADPELRARWRNGEPLQPRDVGAVIRQSLRQRSRPIVTQLLIAANLIVFAFGAYVASKGQNLVGAYLTGMGGGGYIALLRNLGAASVDLIILGDWWRLITTTFLHGGLLHLALNLFTLHGAGRFVEQSWGSWRLIIIYALGGWAGSCLAMGYTFGVPCVGASGAICGVLGAEGVWVLLYARYLPKEMARQGRSQIITTVLFMVFISLLPRVSGWGHLGGALGGAGAALMLHVHRFEPAWIRWVALVAIVPLGWASYAWMERTWSRTNEGQFALKVVFLEHIGKPVEKIADRLLTVCEDQVQTLLEKHPQRRDDTEVQACIETIKKVGDEADKLRREVKKKRLQAKTLHAAREKADEVLDASVTLSAEVVSYLEKGAKAQKADERALRDQFKALDETKHAFEDLLKELAKKEPARRDP